MLQWKTGEKHCGFTVDRVRTNGQAGGTLYEMTHEQTGAALCWMQNEEENKLFSVAFKTTPENDTGVFHILEHSVLGGSEKYPVREPFLELLKSSMNTFLNAMTYSDKTVYPVSSRNERDFFNLTSVYLDAVFAPLLKKDPNIFRQEGWHLEAGEDAPLFNGVVLNEMKGAMSGVDDRISRGIEGLLFPDNCYRYNSGGAPEAIPTLTHEAFVQTYERYYHPSNARFFLDGDLPIEQTLELIDSYLCRFSRRDEPIRIPLQKPCRAVYEGEYPSDTAEGNRDYAAFAKIVASYDDLPRIFAVQILCDYLAGSNAAPLKDVLLRKELCEDVDLFCSDGILQPYLVFNLRNTNKDRKDEILSCVRETVRNIVNEGIPEKDLVAAINKMEFGLRQTPEPKGLYRAINALSSWLYGGDPMLYLDCTAVFARLREMIGTGAYEALLSELFCEWDDGASMILQPSLTLAAEEAAAEAAEAKRRYEALDAGEKEALAKTNRELVKWQATPDSPQALATIPILPLDQVGRTPKHFPTEEMTKNGVRALFHPIVTNGIIHIGLYFPLTAFSLPELSTLSLLPQLFGSLPTARHSVTELQREMKTYIGSWATGITVLSEDSDTEYAAPCFVLHASYLPEYAEPAQQLLAELLTETDFSDRERIMQIVRQTDEDDRQALISSGHALASMAVRAAYSASGAAKEAIDGFSAMRAVHAAAEGGEEAFRAMTGLFRMAAAKIGRNGAVVSVTCDKPAFPETLLSLLPQGEPSPLASRYRTDLPKRMGIRIPAPVSYAVKGYSSPVGAGEPDGGFRVAANILTLSYLWNRVRVQGGAYGTGLSVGGKEGFILYSYRDPDPAGSLHVYDECAAFLDEFAAGDESLDQYIISTVASANPLQTPQAEGITADHLTLCGITDEKRKRNRERMLSLTREDLSDWKPILEEMAKNGGVCVVGGEEALAKCPDLTVFELS